MLHCKTPFCHVWARTLAILLAVFPYHIVSSQSYTRNDSVQIYNWLSQADEQALTGSLDSAMTYAKLALQTSKAKNMRRGEGFAGLKIADILLQKESTDDPKPFFAEGLKIGSQLKDSFMMALVYYQEGAYHMYNDRLEEAEKLFHKSLALKFGKDQSSYTALVYNDLGYLFGLREELEKQVDWYLKAIRLYEKIDNQNGLASTTSSLATVYVDHVERHRAQLLVPRSSCCCSPGWRWSASSAPSSCGPAISNMSPPRARSASPTVTIMWRHLLPNAMVATLTFMPFILSGSITTLTSLDFLGFGLPPGSPSLGELLARARTTSRRRGSASPASSPSRSC